MIWWSKRNLFVVAGAAAVLIGADQFFRVLAMPINTKAASTQETMMIASGGAMLGRRSMSLGCTENGAIQVIAKARLAEREWLAPQERSPASIFFGSEQRKSRPEKATVQTSATLIEKNWIDEIRTDELSKMQVDQIVSALSEQDAGRVSFMTMERGIFLGATATSVEVDVFRSRCSSRAASASEGKR